jgi:hypothetical protein
MTGEYNRLSVLALGMALGLLWGLAILITGLLAYSINVGGAMVTTFGSIYIGYAPTLFGSLVGALWGFADGFIGGVLIALFYNMFLKCCQR